MATLLFDLDGTLIDSAVGITRCVAHAFERMGEPVPDEATLRTWIGPSLRVSFGPILKDEARVEQAVRHYLERFEREGWLEREVYPGIPETIEALHAAGHRLAVVTAKNEPHARKILATLPFAKHFVEIVGATVDGRLSHKPQLIGEALRRLDASPHACTMIGDRRMDMEGAVHHGMRGIGVLWGFGDAAELHAAGADVLAPTPASLVELTA